jgi:ubiquinone/menaquinone biosynthesis C-methylase UbiE
MKLPETDHLFLRRNRLTRSGKESDGKLKEKSRLGFLIELLYFRMREWFSPPKAKLKETDIQPGWYVLDFGCGIGSYTIAAAKFVGETGRVYAADSQPLAVEHVKALASGKGLTNVQTILTDCDTGLENETINVILLYDVLHDLEQPEKVLNELARVLRRDGIISFSDHHMTEAQILSSLTAENRFRLLKEGRFTYAFTHSEKQS